MFLTWHGLSCFSLTEKKLTFVMDPYDGHKKYRLPDLSVDVITFSFEQDVIKNNDKLKVFGWPGEYEVADIHFLGVGTRSPKTDKETMIFKFIADGINICHLGQLDHIPESSVIDKLGKVDLLIAPAANNDLLTAKQVHQLIEEMEPSVLVPMMYDPEDNLESFFKEVATKEFQKVDRLDLKKTSFPAGRTDVYMLEPILG